MEKIQELWDQGYSAVDVVVTIFRVVKVSDKVPEYTKLEFIKVLYVITPAWEILRCAPLGNRVDSHAYSGRCRNPCPAGWSYGSSL